MTDFTKVFVISMIVLFVIIGGPLLSIWSLNTLFKLDIEYTFDTWLAALLLMGAVQTRIKKNN